MSKQDDVRREVSRAYARNLLVMAAVLVAAVLVAAGVLGLSCGPVPAVSHESLVSDGLLT
ncbi:MAG: hypothetical protein DRI34_00145 [Deltaproteobacteria bacterium]|nr:MAG: hypothetical protein DRI34_00145 [Deltaproteobacteria bacterium]